MNVEEVIDYLSNLGYSNVMYTGLTMYEAYDKKDNKVFFIHQKIDNRILIYSYTETITY